MDTLIFLIGYVAALWLAWSVGVLIQRRNGHGRVRQHVLGLLHGAWFSTVVGLLLVPPAHWIGYLIAGALLLMVGTGRHNLANGLPFWTRNSSKFAGGSPPGRTTPGTKSLAPKPDKNQVSKARAEHDRQAAEMALKRAAWDAEHKRSKPQPDKALQQMCREMTADGSLDTEEISDLWLWVKDHPATVTRDLPRELANRLAEAWQDGIISNREAFELFDLASAVAIGLSIPEYKNRFLTRSVASATSIERPRKVGRTRSISKGNRRRGELDIIHFTYETADGDVMDRHVIVQAVDGIYIDGFCLTRKAVRTFRLDRIIGNVSSENTGEVLAPADWAAEFSDATPHETPVLHNPSEALAYCEVLFTGFSATERNRLECLAMSIRMTVRKSVTQNLDYLVAGPRAGASKLAQARLQSVNVITVDDFEQRRSEYMAAVNSN